MADVTITIKTIDQTQKGVKSAKNNFGDLLKGVTAVTATLTAMGFAAKKAFDFAEQGAVLLRTEEKFDRLAKTIGTTGDALMRDLMPATRGMLSQMEAMALATDVMSLGLVKNREDAARLAGVASALGMNMNQLVLTLTNRTTMRFDALGVAVDGFDEKVKVLEESGLSVEEAFTEAFLQQAEAQVEKVGHAADTTAGQFMTLKAGVKDFFDEIKKGVAESDEVEKTLNLLNWAIEKTRDDADLAGTILDFVLNPSMEEAGKLAQDWARAQVENWNTQRITNKILANETAPVLTEHERRMLAVRDAVLSIPERADVDVNVSGEEQAIEEISGFANSVTAMLLGEGWRWNGQRWVIDLSMRVTGGLPTLGGGSTGQGGGYTARPATNTGQSQGGRGGYLPGPGGQHGLDFIVPPGYPNDSFPVRASSGEQVKIIPEGQGGGRSVNIYGGIHFGDSGGGGVFDEFSRELRRL